MRGSGVVLWQGRKLLGGNSLDLSVAQHITWHVHAVPETRAHGSRCTPARMYLCYRRCLCSARCQHVACPLIDDALLTERRLSSLYARNRAAASACLQLCQTYAYALLYAISSPVRVPAAQDARNCRKSPFTMSYVLTNRPNPAAAPQTRCACCWSWTRGSRWLTARAAPRCTGRPSRAMERRARCCCRCEHPAGKPLSPADRVCDSQRHLCRAVPRCVQLCPVRQCSITAAMCDKCLQRPISTTRA